jgi:hypothetical protein
VAGHEGSSGEIQLRVMNSNPWVKVNQELVVMYLVKLSLSYMVLPLCSGVSFQVLWSLPPESDFCIHASHAWSWHPQYCRAYQSFWSTIKHCKRTDYTALQSQHNAPLIHFMHFQSWLRTTYCISRILIQEVRVQNPLYRIIRNIFGINGHTHKFLDIWVICKNVGIYHTYGN